MHLSGCPRTLGASKNKNKENDGKSLWQVWLEMFLIMANTKQMHLSVNMLQAHESWKTNMRH